MLADDALGLYLVADGMGGHAGGEVASRLVAEAIQEFLAATIVDDDSTWPFPFDPGLSYPANRLKAAVLVSNRRVGDHAREHEALNGMGTTLAAVLLGPDRLVLSNVGDCRAYRSRGGVLEQLTRDHSWVAEQVAVGFVSSDAAREHPWRHVVTRAIQGQSDLEVDVREAEIQPGDRLMICSDGLHGVLDDAEIASLFERHTDPASICAALVDAANERGGPDNVSVVIVDVPAPVPAADTPPA